MKNTTITAKMLVKKGACTHQVRLFRRLFGASARVTIKNCVGVASRFNWEWAAGAFLPRISWQFYWKTTDTAWAIYSEVADSPAWTPQLDQTAWKIYDKARAMAFARCVRKWGIVE